MKAQFIKKINMIAQGSEVINKETDANSLQEQRTIELETRILYLEDTVDSLNMEMAQLSQQFDLAKRAIQMLNKKMEQASSDPGSINNPAEEAPPPHY